MAGIRLKRSTLKMAIKCIEALDRTVARYKMNKNDCMDEIHKKQRKELCYLKELVILDIEGTKDEATQDN